MNVLKNFSSDNILRITSDNPLIDPTIVDDLIINYQKISCDYASNNLIRTYPIGLDAENFFIHYIRKSMQKFNFTFRTRTCFTIHEEKFKHL